MKMCSAHWQTCRQAIDAVGLGGLVTQGGDALLERVVGPELEGAPLTQRFDPLWSINSHWWGVALECGGLSIMETPEDGRNDGHYCPLCEMAAHYPDFIVDVEVGKVADDMAAWARTEKLIPALS